MELIAILSLAVIVGVLSVRFGHDTRDELRSKEQLLASYGVTWTSGLPR
jgi:hypothetical protein